MSKHVSGTAQGRADATIFRQIEDIKAAWGNGDLSRDGWTDAQLARFLDTHVNRPEEELRAMRPKTVAGALAKVRFAKWYAKAAGSDDPAYRGLDIAIADLKALAVRKAA